MKTNTRSFVSQVFGVAGLSLFLGSALMMAQESSREAATVPFAFHARETTLPAGSYTVKIMDPTGVLQIADRKTGRSIMVPTRGRQSGPLNTPRLAFHRYGSEYFLSEVWMADRQDGYTVSKCAREKELAKQPGQLAYASISLQGE